MSAVITIPLAIPVTVPNGGTGDTTLTAHGVLIGEGTSPVAVTGAGTTGQVLTSNGASADPTFQASSAREFSGYTTTVTSATPINLLVTDTFVQRYTGSAAQVIRLPVTTTLTAKFAFLFVNDNSVGNLTLTTSNGSFIYTMGPGEYVLAICILASGTTAASWKVIPIPLVIDDGTMAALSITSPPSQAAVISYVGSQLAAAILAYISYRSIYTSFDDSASARTDGVQEELRSYNIGGGLLALPGDGVIQEEVVTTVGSATASRRIKKFLNDTTDHLIWDSGSLTLSLGTQFHIRTTVIMIDDTSVRIDVAVTTTSASTVPYVTYTEILTLDGLAANDTNLTTAVNVSGVGAAAGDIVSRMAHLERVLAPL